MLQKCQYLHLIKANACSGLSCCQVGGVKGWGGQSYHFPTGEVLNRWPIWPYPVTHILFKYYFSVQHMQVEKLTHKIFPAALQKSDNPATPSLWCIICRRSGVIHVPNSLVFSVSWCLTLNPISSFPWSAWPLVTFSFLTLVYYVSSILVLKAWSPDQWLVTSINDQSYPMSTESETLGIVPSAVLNKPFR